MHIGIGGGKGSSAPTDGKNDKKSEKWGISGADLKGACREKCPCEQCKAG